MLNANPIPWYLRLMYLLPIFLCIAITIFVIADYTKTETTTTSTSSAAASSAVTLNEETERGEEILDQYQQQQETEQP